MRSIEEIKKGMKSKNQNEWATFDEIDLIMDKVEKATKIFKDIETIQTWDEWKDKDLTNRINDYLNS